MERPATAGPSGDNRGARDARVDRRESVGSSSTRPGVINDTRLDEDALAEVLDSLADYATEMLVERGFTSHRVGVSLSVRYDPA